MNLVNVAEPLKVARMIVGVDDTAPGEVKLVPRLPPTWQGAVAENWPIRTSRGVVRAEIRVEREGDDVHGSLRVRSGARIPRLAVRLVKGGQVAWQRVEEVSALAG